MAVAERSARNAYIVEQRQTGRSYRDLGRELGLSQTRVREIVLRDHQRQALAQKNNPFAETHIDWPETMPYPTVELTTRAWNCYLNAVVPTDRTGIQTVEELRTLLARPYQADGRLRNCGRKTRQELLRWLDTRRDMGLLCTLT